MTTNVPTFADRILNLTNCGSYVKLQSSTLLQSPPCPTKLAVLRIKHLSVDE